jgi:hypothetical protein
MPRHPESGSEVSPTDNVDRLLLKEIAVLFPLLKNVGVAPRAWNSGSSVRRAQPFT